ncbi:MAG: enoyl-CoA hydratase [Gemmatimonadota bacterium]
MPDVSFVRYEEPAERVARLVVTRAEKRNAQNTELLYQLNDAFDRAAQDDRIRVIILATEGPDFSSGHDLAARDQRETMEARHRVGTWGGGTGEGLEPLWAYEREVYLGFSERWRNIPKPTIAQVQGRCIAGGLMLVWPCDLVVASDDALFRDHTLMLGVPGCEFFMHPWEVGVRQAKEWLFTCDWLTAERAYALGMVNRVVPLALLAEATLELARGIAERPLAALRLAKAAVNAAQDAQGRGAALETAFGLHQLGHAHNLQVHGQIVDPAGLPRKKGPDAPA